MAEAQRAKDRGIELYVVAVGDYVDFSEINEMASDPDTDHVVELKDVNQVDNAVNDILDALCA